MNLIILTAEDFVADDRVRLGGRRADHIRTVHRAEPGQIVRVGLLGGKMGEGHIQSLDDSGVELVVSLDREPPAALGIKLFLALPRPKYLARCLQMATSMGIKQIYLFNTFRVEKIYWSCAQITPEEIRSACLLGLEQARDTLLPEVHLKRLFKPFVEDELPALVAGSTALVAHPSAREACPFNLPGEVSLAVGPEGGFIEYEIQKLSAAGFLPVRTLERILKVETALASLVGRLK